MATKKKTTKKAKAGKKASVKKSKKKVAAKKKVTKKKVAKKKVSAKPAAKKKVVKKPAPKKTIAKKASVSKSSSKPAAERPRLIVASSEMEMDISPIPSEHLDHSEIDMPMDDDIKDLKGFDDEPPASGDLDEDDDF
jgi:hypothetical protein